MINLYSPLYQKINIYVCVTQLFSMFNVKHKQIKMRLKFNAKLLKSAKRYFDLNIFPPYPIRKFNQNNSIDN